MTRPLRFLAALALLAGAGAAFAFVRSTTTPGHPESGVCLWWGKREVTYVVNATGTAATGPAAPCQDGTAAVAEVDAVFPVWGQSCSDFRFVNGGTSSKTAQANDGTNLVVFRSGVCFGVFGAVVPANDSCRNTAGACATKYNCWEHDATGDGENTVALTTTTFDTSTGEILDADVELHGWNGVEVPATGSYFTCAGPGSLTCTKPPYGQSGCNWIDVGTIVLHEAGHMLGLDHTCQYAAPYNACPDASVMAPSGSPGDVKRLLAQDDANAVCTLYPTGGATLKCVADTPTQKKQSGGCAAGSAGSGGVALVVVLALLLRLRREGVRGSARE